MSPSPPEPSDAQNALMERARRRSGSDRKPRRRALAPRLSGLALAALVALIIGIGFDRFLTALQRYIVVQTAEPSPSAAPSPPEQMPVFVVLGEPPAAGATSTPNPQSRPTK